MQHFLQNERGNGDFSVPKLCLFLLPLNLLTLFHSEAVAMK